MIRIIEIIDGFEFAGGWWQLTWTWVITRTEGHGGRLTTATKSFSRTRRNWSTRDISSADLAIDIISRKCENLDQKGFKGIPLTKLKFLKTSLLRTILIFRRNYRQAMQKLSFILIYNILSNIKNMTENVVFLFFVCKNLSKSDQTIFVIYRVITHWNPS